MSRELTSEEKYIIAESAEILVGETIGWAGRFLTVFPALKNRNFRLYFFGQFVSLIGTWLQIVAEGWLVFQMTHSAFLVGLVAALATAPTLIFSLFGGVIVDRLPKRNILLFTQAASMILALVYGLLVVFKFINIGEIYLLAFLLGVVNALDAPARQAFVGEMVGREYLASAIALTAGTWNGARVIGPSVAGILIAAVGVGGAFIINGISYVAVIVALVLMRIVSIKISDVHPHPLEAIRDGLSYSFSHPTIRTLLIFSSVVSIFGWSFSTIMPVIAQNTFHVGAVGLGQLYSASGVGAFLATIFVSALGRKFSPYVFILSGNTLFALSLFLFTMTSNFGMALVFLFFAGFGLLVTFPTISSTIQHLVEDKYRGRVLSIYTVTFLGFFPIGNLEVGLVSEHWGTNFAIRLGAAVILAAGILFYLSRNKAGQANARYPHNSRNRL
jgi:MFS family permease